MATPLSTAKAPDRENASALLGVVRVAVLRGGVPGRARVRIVGLYRCEALRAALEALPRSCPCLQVVRASTLTGNALVLYDADRAIAEPLAVLERAVRNHDGPNAEPSIRVVRSGAAPQCARPVAAGEGGITVGEVWHARPAAEVLRRFSSRTEGLSGPEAAQRLARHGPNVLTEAPRRSMAAMLLEQLASPPVALLGLSAVVSVATGGMADAVVILGVIVINAAIGCLTEAQAENTIQALSRIGPTRAKVVRDGRKSSIAIAEVVPGDILALSPGVYVPADARVLSASQLSVDESALTGESLPAAKRPDVIGALDTPLGDRQNMVYRGTVVTGGNGRAVVVATGTHTEIGVIQSLVGEVRPPDTPLQRQLDDMGMQLAILSGAICAGVFGIGVLRGVAWLEMLKSAISLAVAAVPEGLPAVATTTLALGIREMQRRHVLVRQLPAVESLGAVQTLCFDKTGTLTENRMRVAGIELPDCAVSVSPDGLFDGDGRVLERGSHVALDRLIEVVALCSEVRLSREAAGPPLDGSPTETALVEVALLAGGDPQRIRRSYPLLRTVHRAEGRPYMATLHERGGGGVLVAVKGAPGDVLALCEFALAADGPVPLDEWRRSAVSVQNERMAGQALRVLGIAVGDVENAADDAAIRKLTWLGLVGMEDGIRPGIAELIAQFHEAGIDTVMITGDQSATAYSVGRRLGLNHDKSFEIVDSTGLDQLDPHVLKSIVQDTTVFARVSPAHKLRIVQAFQHAGRVVAMTGDGINDGPALKAADVGVAMGQQGTEVARSVADIVLERDDLQTMIGAVQQGRTIYRNIRKSLQYLLSSNLSEIEIMVVGTALGAGEVLNPIQLLWINLITDILPALGLALEPPESDVLRERPRDPDAPILRRADLFRLFRQSAFISAGTLGVYGYSLARYGMGALPATHSFMTLTLAQLLHAISCRSETSSVAHAGRREGNPVLTVGIAASFALQIAAAFVPSLRKLLRLGPIGPADWSVIAIGALLPFVANEGAKHLPRSMDADQAPR